METRIIIVTTDADELNVCYCLPSVTEDEITRLYKKVAKVNVTDIYEETQDNLQYYCIDGRVWLDDETKVNRMRQLIG